MKKNEVRSGIVLIIIAVIFTLVALILPFSKNAVFWTSWLFGILSAGVCAFALKTAFRGGANKGEGAKSKFYGFPIAKVGLLYMAVQLVLSLIFMAMSSVLPPFIPAVASLILLGVAAIGLIGADAVRDEVERQDIKLTTDTKCMQNLRSIVYPLAAQCADSEASSALQKLADDFRYSDPVSSDSTADIEKDLTAQMGDLQAAVIDGNAGDIKELCRKIGITLTERNRLCKLGKKK